MDKVLRELNITSNFWDTYVDDHLTSILTGMIQKLKDKLNSFNDSVQFTEKTQDDLTDSINFLDTTVYNCGTHLKTK